MLTVFSGRDLPPLTIAAVQTSFLQTATPNISDGRWAARVSRQGRSPFEPDGRLEGADQRDFSWLMQHTSIRRDSTHDHANARLLIGAVLRYEISIRRPGKHVNIRAVTPACSLQATGHVDFRFGPGFSFYRAPSHYEQKQHLLITTIKANHGHRLIPPF
jgi:hypothetical protein